MKMLMRLLFAASICLLIACTASAMPPSVDHTDNYTVILTYGQTPYQIGYRASGNVTAWNWWDTGEGMQQQNLILAMVLNKTAHPVGGLSPPSFSLSQTRFRVGLNTYSWKADDDGTGNYSNNMDIWHWIPLNLTEHYNPELTFYTWHRIVPGDYGYVKVSTDGGNEWTELANYTGNQTGIPDEKTISLNAYNNTDIILAFNFVSDSSGVDEGWYIDDIKVVADGFTVPFFEWRLFGSTIFRDGATSAPSELVVEVSYPSYYSTRTETIKLQEYSKGLYGGIFYYASNDTYSGRYEINFTNQINGTDPAVVMTTFDTTLWGCQASNCHDAWSPTNDPSNRTLTDVVHPDNITSSTATNCLTACHTPSASQFLRATPVHLHEIVYGHYGGFVCGDAGWVEIFNKTSVNIQMYRDTSVKRPLVQGAFDQPSHAYETAPVDCIDCHTKFVHDKTGSVSYPVALHTLQGTNITYGVHSNVSCEKCHGNLSYPAFTSGVYSLDGALNDYVPEFMSYEESTETYIIDVDGTAGINVTVVAEDTNHAFLVSLIGPVDNTTTGLCDLNRSDPWRGTYLLPSINGTAIFVAGGKICYPYGEYLNVVTFDSDSPDQGKWVVRILARSTGKFNYTITSNYTIARKPVIHIPWNCSECHQASPPAGCEGAIPETGAAIPDWDNYGLAYTHTDIDGNGSDDVTCRACHNALHDVGILNCVDCHQTPPGGHTSIYSTYSKYLATTYEDCLRCHNDPHYEPERAAGGDCADCHLSGGMNATDGLPIIDRDGFFGSVHVNITGDFDSTNNTTISMVCWGCHNNYSEQLLDPKHFRIKPNCTDCHFNATPMNDEYLSRSPQQGPPQALEHQPEGIDVITAVNCTTCHNKSLVNVSGVPPTADVNNPSARNFVSHYGRQRDDIIVDGGNASDCAYCHLGGGAEFNGVFEDKSNANITHGVDCAACHGYGRIHDDVFTVPVMTPGNNSLCFACHDDLENYTVNSSRFNEGIHAGANCTDCHTPLPVRINQKVSVGDTVCYNVSVVEETKELNVTIRWNSSSGDLDLTLKYPNGTEINSSALPDIKYVTGSDYEYYWIYMPINGTWQACVTGVADTPDFRLAVEPLVKHPGIKPPHDCEDCHVNPLVEQVYGALQAIQHKINATDVPVRPECMGCHNKSEMILPHGYEVESEAANVSHYGKPRYDMIVKIDNVNTTNCSHCHLGGGKEFEDVFADKSNANITHGVDCAACHGYGRIHDDVFTVPVMTPGNNSLCFACHDDLENYTVNSSRFNEGIHAGANCTDCHTPLPVRINQKVSVGDTVCYNVSVVEETKELNVTIRWNSSSGDLDLTLKYPNGTEINSSALPDIKYVTGSDYEYYWIYMPINGTWQACVTGVADTPDFRLAVEPLVKHPGIKPPHDCEDCHVNPLVEQVYGALQAVQHTRNATDVHVEPECMGCHNKSEMILPHSYEVESEAANVSHYGKPRRYDIVNPGNASSNCSYCHRGGGNEFNDVFADKTRANVTHDEGFDVNCTDCHGYGRIHDAAISSPTMVPGNNSLCMNPACHGNPLKPWFIDISAFNSGIHSGANCTDCHTPLQPIDDIRGSVSTGETRCYPFDVPEKINDVKVKQLNVTLNWVSGNLSLILFDANDEEINQSVAETNPNIKYTANKTFISYLITNPINGPWEACVSGADTTTRFDLGVEFIFGHPKHGECYTNPCYLCHVTNISYNAPPVAEHVTNDTPIDAEVWTEASCTDCHRNDIIYPPSIIAAGVNISNGDSMSAHYGVPSVLDTRDCISCHENKDIGREWGDAPDPREILRYEYVENASDTSNTLRTGEVWRLKNEYEIVVGPVSSTGSSVWIDLAHNGVSVQRELVSEGGVFEYEIKKDWIKSKSNAGDPLYGTKHETYKHRQSDKSSYTTIVDLKVDDIFTSGMMGVVTFKGLIIKSRIHFETENKPCYTCHVDGYRYYAPEDGDSYVVLRNTGADGDHSDSDDITIGRVPINFTEREHRMQYVQSGWDLGYGYLLQITEVDLVGRKALVELSKDGRVLQREVVPEGEIFRYNTTITDKEGHTMNNVTVFEMRIAEVFRR